jgi:hypothetical protein
VAAFGPPEGVRRALESVAAQDYRKYEILVYGDGTPTDLHSIVMALKLPDAKVFDLPLPGRGHRVAAAFNAGLRDATGDAFCFLDATAHYCPGWFSAAASFFTQAANGRKMACFGRLLPEEAHPTQAKAFRGGQPVARPAGVLHHVQVMHRRLEKPATWDERVRDGSCPGGAYLQWVSQSSMFFSAGRDAAVLAS